MRPRGRPLTRPAVHLGGRPAWAPTCSATAPGMPVDLDSRFEWLLQHYVDSLGGRRRDGT